MIKVLTRIVRFEVLAVVTGMRPVVIVSTTADKTSMCG